MAAVVRAVFAMRSPEFSRGYARRQLVRVVSLTPNLEATALSVVPSVQDSVTAWRFTSSACPWFPCFMGLFLRCYVVIRQRAVMRLKTNQTTGNPYRNTALLRD